MQDGGFNHQKLFDITYAADRPQLSPPPRAATAACTATLTTRRLPRRYIVTRNLNRVIDNNYYPVEAARISNMKHRPVGLGVQGLADTFILLKLPFDGDEARKLNREIFETIYFAALSGSCDLAAKEGHYESYPGSPVSKGVLQFDMWRCAARSPAALRASIAPLTSPLLRSPRQVGRHAVAAVGLGGAASQDRGARRAQLAPRRADAHRVDGADPRQQRVLRAVHVQPVLAPHALRRVRGRQPAPAARPHGAWAVDGRDPQPGAPPPAAPEPRPWRPRYPSRALPPSLPPLSTPALPCQIIAHNGSVQRIPEIPADLKLLYRTSWELKQRGLIDMAADRGAFIDQSQSFNVFVQAS